MAKKKIEKKYWRNLLSTSNNLKRLLDKYEYIVFFDTETTGLNTSKERIIQISAIKTDKELNIIDKFNSYCNPYPMLISPKITQITGITQNDVNDAPLETEVMRLFNEFSQNSFFVAYNSEFDYEMTTSAFARAKISRVIEHFDAREISYDFAPESSDCSFHDSMFDVEMTYELFKMFYNKYVNFRDTEINKNKVKVYAINPWSIGKNKRIYVATSSGTFYYDLIKKHWGEKDTPFTEVNMSNLEWQALEMTKKMGYDSFSKIKEGFSYRDLQRM